MKNFLLLLISLIIPVIPSALPVELQKKVIQYFSINPEDVLQTSLNKFYINTEGLVFPSTGPVTWVRANTIYDHYTQSELRTLEQNNVVLPHLQLWFSYNKFRVDNDLKGVHTNLTNFSPTSEKELTFFDGRDDDLVVLLTQARDNITITIRDLADSANEIQIYCSPGPLHPVSLCFHNNEDPLEYSFITQSDDNTVNMHVHSLQYFLFKKFFDLKKQEIPISPEFFNVKKHEFIGKNTFLMLCDHRLFFMVLDAVATYKKQHFKGSESEQEIIVNTNKKAFIEYDVISFAAYQEERTSNGRARFIVVLVRIKSDAEKKIFLIDLLDPYNMATPIWYSGEDNCLYDRISFVGNIVSLWVGDRCNPSALEIRLPINWVDNVVKVHWTLRMLKKMPKSKKTAHKIIDKFNTLRVMKLEESQPEIIESFGELSNTKLPAAAPAPKTENLGKLLLPKKRGNYGEPFHIKTLLGRHPYHCLGLVFAAGLVTYAFWYLINSFC